MTAQSKELQQIESVTISQTGEQFLRDQELMQHALERLEDQRKEIDRLNDMNIKNSIKFEELKKDNDKVKSQLKTSNRHLFNFLDEMEGRFDSDEKFDSPQICIEYLDAAKYCEKYFDRVNNRVREAQRWYDSLESWEQTDKLK